MANKIFFGTLAFEMIQDSGRTVVQVAEAIGKTPQNQFSKWKAGKWTYIAPPKLRRIIDEVAGRDREKRVALQIAYLIDMTLDEFRPLVDIVPKTGSETTQAVFGDTMVPGLREKLEEMGKAYPQDGNFAKLCETMFGIARGINSRPASGK